MKRKVISDIEANGLLPELTTHHCSVAIDIATGEVFDWEPDRVKESVEFLVEECDTIIGHNWIGYDKKAINKLHGRDQDKEPWLREDLFAKHRILDTLVLCKMIWPVDALIGPDMQKFRKGTMPGKYLKRQSLGAWGYRLGNYKGEFNGGFEHWSREMHDYMIQDARVNLDLWKLICQKLNWDPALACPWVAGEEPTSEYVWPEFPIDLEMQMAEIVQEQEEVGFSFDRERAIKMVHELRTLQEDTGNKLVGVFGEWWQPKDNVEKGIRPKVARAVSMPEYPDVTYKRVSPKTGKPLKDYVGPPKEYYDPEAPYVRIERTTFNPSSRKHLGDRLQAQFGWKPQKWGAKQATVDESVIKEIPKDVISEDVRQCILDYFVVTKTLGMLQDGAQGWMNTLKDDDRQHGRCDPLGTITHRAAHSHPNTAQTPSVKKDKDDNILYGLKGGFGYECRSLWRATPGWELSGTDKSSLEFILLGHYIHKFDGGVFSARVCDPKRDPHKEHSELTGLNRQDTKTVGYMYIFGGGAPKVGHAVGWDDAEVPELLQSKAMKSRLQWLKRIDGDEYEEPSDHEKAAIGKGYIVIRKFEKAITGLKDLKQDLTNAASRGWLKAIDGRKLMVRKPHAALSTILQGGGSIACKVWIVTFRRMMIERGYLPRRDWNQVAWVHDELQIEHKPGLGPIVKEVSLAASKEAGRILGLRGEFRTDTKTGQNWAETH